MAKVYNSQLDAFSLYHRHQSSSLEPASSLSAEGPVLPALGHALAGSTGTAISNLVIYPLSLVITRLQVQRALRKSVTTAEDGEYKGVLDAFEQIYQKEGGISAFYVGVVQDTGKSIADSFLFFLCYNYLRSSRLQSKKSTNLPALDELAVGSLAGAVAKLFTTPLSNIVTRKQTSSMQSARTSSSTVEPTVRNIAKAIRKEKGLQGFWSGYSASLVLTLNPSITFFLYEIFKRTLLPRSKRDDPGARITFLMAALSKAIASAATYPFSLAKARAQVSSRPPVDGREGAIVKEDFKNVHGKCDVEKAGKDASRFAKRSTIFDSILQIYRAEGAVGLYEGVWGEIIKGFFSHGITMILKESIHKLIIQAYYLLLKALNKYPSPSELAKQAGDAVQDAGERAGEIVKDGYEHLAKNVKKAGQGGKEYFDLAAERARGAGSEATERVGVAGGNVVQATKLANDFASKEAGHLLGNAQEQLGDRIESFGQGLKPDTEN